MKIISAVIAVVAVFSLAGCGESNVQPSSDQQSQSKPTQTTQAAANDDGFGVYTAETPEGTVYTLDLSKPYSDELTDKTDKATFEALEIPEEEQDGWQWFELSIDNANGSESSSYSMTDIALVTETEEQVYLTTAISEVFGDVTGDYETELVEQDRIDESEIYTDVYNEWLDTEMPDVKPGAKASQPAWLMGTPEEIKSVWFGDIEMQLKK